MNVEITALLIMVVAQQFVVVVSFNNFIGVRSKREAKSMPDTVVEMLPVGKPWNTENDFLLILYCDVRFEDYLLPGPNAVAALYHLALISPRGDFKVGPDSYFHPTLKRIFGEAWSAFNTAGSGMTDMGSLMEEISHKVQLIKQILAYKISGGSAYMVDRQLGLITKATKENIQVVKKAYLAFDVIIKLLNEVYEDTAAADVCSSNHVANIARKSRTTGQEHTFVDGDIALREMVPPNVPAISLDRSTDMAHYMANNRKLVFNETQRWYDKYFRRVPMADKRLSIVSKRSSLLKADSINCVKTKQLLRAATTDISNLKKQFGRLVRFCQMFPDIISIMMEKDTADFRSTAKKLAHSSKTGHKFHNARVKGLKNRLRTAASRISTVSEYLGVLSGTYNRNSGKYITVDMRDTEKLLSLSGFRRNAKLQEVLNQMARARKDSMALAESKRASFSDAIKKSKDKIKKIFAVLGPTSEDEKE